MIQAELHRLHSPDAPDLHAYVPLNPDRFSVLVQAMIGPKGGQGEESFDFVVCSPTWLGEQASAEGCVIGRHHIVMNQFDADVLRATIENLCRQATGPDWESVACYLARFGQWEFEDYRDSSA
jgi:hypothetical protein